MTDATTIDTTNFATTATRTTIEPEVFKDPLYIHCLIDKRSKDAESIRHTILYGTTKVWILLNTPVSRTNPDPKEFHIFLSPPIEVPDAVITRFDDYVEAPADSMKSSLLFKTDSLEIKSMGMSYGIIPAEPSRQNGLWIWENGYRIHGLSYRVHIDLDTVMYGYALKGYKLYGYKSVIDSPSKLKVA